MRNLQGVMAKVLDCDIVESSNFNFTFTFTFRLMPLEKTINPFYPPPSMRENKYRYLSSTRIDLALNNPRRLICHSINYIPAFKLLVLDFN